MKRWLRIVLFLLCLFVFGVIVCLFYRMGFYVDEHGTSPAAVWGGNRWLWLDWVHLFASFAACILSGILVFKKD
ncbi:MAG: hypothetical protein VB086_13265 [Clostridiaceae bacterium]|nr:hypothetical protein [Clostridiaceae bacterium]